MISHTLPEQKSEEPFSLQLNFFFINMGSSECDIVEKLVRQLQRAHPGLDIAIEMKFFAGDLLWAELMKSKNKMGPYQKGESRAGKKHAATYNELLEKFLGETNSDEALNDIRETFSKSSIHIQSCMLGSYQAYHDPDTILLKQYGIVGDNKKNKNMPYIPLSKLNDYFEKQQAI